MLNRLRSKTRPPYGGILTAVGSVLAGVKWVSDWIGRSTLLDDAALLTSRTGKIVKFVADQPTLLFYGFCVLLLAMGVALLIPWGPKPNREKAGDPDKQAAATPLPEPPTPVEMAPIKAAPTAPTFDPGQAIAQRDRIRETIKVFEPAIQVSRDTFDAWLDRSKVKIYGSGLTSGNHRVYKATFSDWRTQTSMMLAELDWPLGDRPSLARDRETGLEAPHERNMYDFNGVYHDPMRVHQHRGMYWQGMETFESLDRALEALKTEDRRLDAAIARHARGETP